jgi:hypothetical protein
MTLYRYTYENKFQDPDTMNIYYETTQSSWTDLSFRAWFSMNVLKRDPEFLEDKISKAPKVLMTEEKEIKI